MLDAPDDNDPTVGTPYADYLEKDRNAFAPMVAEAGDAKLGLDDVPVERYIDRGWYDLEKKKVWPSVWQVACRVDHIPEPGDYYVYEICDRSYLIVRTDTGAIKAYPNACLHRGRKLRTQPGSAKEFRCPFHGMTWALDGSMTHLPCGWDFPQIQQDKFNLPEAAVDTWAGWVFINPDGKAGPLSNYLDPINDHYKDYRFDQSFLGVHVGKVIKANWKVVMEAFMEAWHAHDTHPQILPYTGDTNAKYDQWEGKPHVNRMINGFAVPSPYVEKTISQQEIYDAMISMPGRIATDEQKSYKLKDGETARHAMAEVNRTMAETMLGEKLPNASDAELCDGFYYNIFPNFTFVGGYGPNLIYRFRPWKDDHETALMEAMFLLRHPKDQPKPKAAPMRLLDVDEPWTTAPELGALGPVFDQDIGNLAYVQEGLHATHRHGVVLADYQEGRIRHFHQTFTAYIDRSEK